MIAGSRASIAKAQKHFADSFERLADSQNRSLHSWPVRKTARNRLPPKRLVTPYSLQRGYFIKEMVTEKPNFYSFLQFPDDDHSGHQNEGEFQVGSTWSDPSNKVTVKVLDIDTSKGIATFSIGP